MPKNMMIRISEGNMKKVCLHYLLKTDVQVLYQTAEHRHMEGSGVGVKVGEKGHSTVPLKFCISYIFLHQECVHGC